MPNKPKPQGLAEDARVVLAEALLGITSSPGEAIERQEARGQATFVQSSLLPVEYGHDSAPEQLEAMGVILGDVVEDDPIFREATLPDGWAIIPSDHSMWSHLVDVDGMERASIFYKAAFYDRSALIHVNEAK